MFSTHHRNLASLALCALSKTTSASPISLHVIKRDMGAGAKAGLGIGIAVAVVIVILVVTFFIIHLRRQAHNASINNERAVLAGEKNIDDTDKPDKFAPVPTVSAIPRRNKSVKDRLMGPLYRGSMIEMPSMPHRAKIGSNRQSTMTVDGDSSWLNKPWAASGENSPRPSFSSKRATRMMMMM